MNVACFKLPNVFPPKLVKPVLMTSIVVNFGKLDAMNVVNLVLFLIFNTSRYFKSNLNSVKREFSITIVCKEPGV